MLLHEILKNINVGQKIKRTSWEYECIEFTNRYMRETKDRNDGYLRFYPDMGKEFYRSDLIADDWEITNMKLIYCISCYEGLDEKSYKKSFKECSSCRE